MGRRSTVESLPDEQLEFVILEVLDQKTDREISANFHATFGKELPKSSLNNWRKISGNELADRYRLVRLQARQLREDLELEEGDDYQNVIKNIEERLLTATREVIHQNPLKLLAARQEDERLKIKREQIDLNRQKLDFDKQKHEREASVRVDRLAIAAEVCKYILFWTSENEPHVADALTRRMNDILAGVEGHIENEAA